MCFTGNSSFQYSCTLHNQAVGDFGRHRDVRAVQDLYSLGQETCEFLSSGQEDLAWEDVLRECAWLDRRHKRDSSTIQSVASVASWLSKNKEKHFTMQVDLLNLDGYDSEEQDKVEDTEVATSVQKIEV